jgi:hypothetical protein
MMPAAVCFAMHISSQVTCLFLLPQCKLHPTNWHAGCATNTCSWHAFCTPLLLLRQQHQQHWQATAQQFGTCYTFS